MKQQLRGTFYLLLATVIWGSAFVAQSVGMDLVGPFTFQAVRCALAAIALLPAIALADGFKNDGKTFLQRWMNKKLWKTGLLCSIPLFFACNLQQVGLVDTDAGKSAFLTAMYIIIVPLIGMFRKQKVSKLIGISVVLAVVGLYFLCCMGVTSITLADLLLLGCALMFAIQIILVDMYAMDLDAIRLNCIQAFFCAVFSATVMFPLESPDVENILQCWLPLCYAGVLSMGVAYTLQIVGQKVLEPSTASLIMSLESVFAVLAGWMILGERLTLWEGIGCVLVFAAVILSQIPVKEKVKA